MAHVIRCLGPHHDTSCRRYVADVCDRSTRIQTIEHSIKAARAEAAKAKDKDYIIIYKLHTEGTAYRSGLVKNGDEIISVAGKSVGDNVKLAAELLRGDSNTQVRGIFCLLRRGRILCKLNCT